MSRNKCIVILFISLWLCLWGATAVAQSQNPLILTNDQEQHPLGPHLEILEDKEGAWTIEDVTSPEIAAQFVPNREESPGFGFTDSAYWVRIQATNEADAASNWLIVLDTDVYTIDYYYPIENGVGYDSVHTGTARPFATRDVSSTDYVFRLPLPPQQTETIYMRFESEATLILALSLWSESAYFQYAKAKLARLSFFYGILFILAGYNLVFFFYIRDNSYLFYALFFGTILLGIIGIDGFGDQYLWPNWPGLAATADRFFVVLSFSFALLFATSFLRTKEFTPRLHKIMLGLATTILILLALQFIWFRQTAVIHIFLLLASCVTIIVAGLLVWRKGYSPARYFLLGWLPLLIGFAIFVLTLIDVLPWVDMTDSLLRLGLVILAFVLSIGLADRINRYRREKVAAQLAVAAQRSRIAQDLHDSVTQSLYSTNLFAEAGRETVQAGDTEGASHYFTRIGAVSQQALKEMRLFLYELRPPDVVDVGLVDALQKRLDAVEKRSGMEVRLILDGDIHCEDEIADQYYRIAQEALNNVLKHAQADEVTVYLRAENGIMGLEVADNGRGFDLAEARKSGGLGLKTMQERSEQINGEFEITTAPNQGTKVMVQVKQSHE